MAYIATAITAMKPEDIPSAHSLLTNYLKQFKLAPQLSEEEFAHWLLPREGVVDCFVVKNEKGKVRSGATSLVVPACRACCVHLLVMLWCYLLH